MNLNNLQTIYYTYYTSKQIADVRTGGKGSKPKRTPLRTEGGGGGRGVRNCQMFAFVLYGWPLPIYIYLGLKELGKGNG